MTDEPNDIDQLMAIDPLELTKADLLRIVNYQRKMRAQREAGVRTKKPKYEVPSGSSLDELLKTIPKPDKGPMDRRF